VNHISEDDVRRFAERGYRDGVAAVPVVAARSALIVVDMQNEFVRPRWSPYWIPGATAIVPTIAQMIKKCRAVDVPVIYTVFADTHHRLDRPRGLAAMPNTAVDWTAPPEAAQVWPALAPEPNDVVICKPSYGAFYDTPLDTILRRLGRDTIILTGTLTNFCVGMTARQGYERSYHVVVAQDATATDVPELHEAELATLRRGFALVLPAAEIETRLSQ
jgi:nicotinamidase-related amidase